MLFILSLKIKKLYHLKIMKQILENLQNWQTKKKNKADITAILIKAEYFDIHYLKGDDEAKSYHIYPALEIIQDKEKKTKGYKFILYMVAENKDNKKFLDDYKGDFNEIIRKFNVVNYTLGEDVEISEKEAKERKERWSKEIADWVKNNEVFDVFDIPMEDFNFTNKWISMEGHFGMKDCNEKEGEKEDKKEAPIEKASPIEKKASPDIVIYQTNSESKEQAFFDMARLSPPFRHTKPKEEFALLQYEIETKSLE